MPMRNARTVAGSSMSSVLEGVPYGHCRCGCGQRTSIVKESNASRGWVRGEPMRFMHGHRQSPSWEERFWAKVERRSEGPTLLASAYGVSVATIDGVLSGRTWSHL